jgi:hypothetical protein
MRRLNIFLYQSLSIHGLSTSRKNTEDIAITKSINMTEYIETFTKVYFENEYFKIGLPNILIIG